MLTNKREQENSLYLHTCVWVCMCIHNKQGIYMSMITSCLLYCQPDSHLASYPVEESDLKLPFWRIQIICPVLHFFSIIFHKFYSWICNYPEVCSESPDFLSLASEFSLASLCNNHPISLWRIVSIIPISTTTLWFSWVCSMRRLK